jgi:hypothetical protein
MINSSRILKSFLDSNTFIFLSVIFLCIFARGLWLVFKHNSSGKGTWHLIAPFLYILSFPILPQFDQYGTCTSTTARLKGDLGYIRLVCLNYWDDLGSNKQCSIDKVREILKSDHTTLNMEQKYGDIFSNSKYWEYCYPNTNNYGFEANGTSETFEAKYYWTDSDGPQFYSIDSEGKIERTTMAPR